MKSNINRWSVFMFLFVSMAAYWGGNTCLNAESSGVELVGQWNETGVDTLFMTLFIKGNTAYLGGNNRLVILDIADKSNPRKLTEMPVKGYVAALYVSGDYAYVADSACLYEEKGMRIVDVSNPASPQQVGFYRTILSPDENGVGCGSIRSVFVTGNLAYVGTGEYFWAASPGTLEVVDISNPASPRLKGRSKTDFIEDVYVSGDYAYCAYFHQSAHAWNWGGFGIIDITNPESPLETWKTNFLVSAYAKSVSLAGNYAYVASIDRSKGNLMIFDAADPHSPHLGMIYNTPGSAEDVYISGDYAYIADGTAGLRVVDISKPYGPFEMAYYETPGSAQEVVVSGGYTYVGTDTGLSILRVNPTLFIQPQITLEKNQLYFGAVEGTSVSTGTQGTWIFNYGGGPLNWSASTDTNWLSAAPTSGIGDSLVEISINAAGLPVGTYNGTVTIADANASNNPQVINVVLKVYPAGAAASPFGYFETPREGAAVMGSVPVTGWVLHDIGVESIKIYRDPLPGEGINPVYIGDAIFVEGARPDVAAAYPDYPLNSRAGWGYMLLTNFLPNGGNGTFTLRAVVTTVNGQQLTWETKTITCDNASSVKPFGAIDTPTQGGMASGKNFINWGWALTPQPNQIPTNGSTIDVRVDGVSLGHPIYNLYRTDIASLFPGYVNSNGAVGYFSLDTTPYANGIHTMHWTVYNSAMNVDSIGSRYFNILNSEGRTAQGAERTGFNVQRSRLKVNSAQIPVEHSQPVGIRKGFNPNLELQKIYPDEKGTITIEIKELENLEIHFFGPGESIGEKNLEHPGPIISNISSLPIGSTLDTKRGIFYWSPGVGFLGAYEMEFVKDDGNGEAGKIKVIVRIVPRY